VRIGFSLLLCNRVEIGDRVTVGHFNVFKQLKRLSVGSDCTILNMNYFSGASYENWPCNLIIGSGTVLTSHHYLDCGGTIHIGEKCTIGGRDTHFWTHSLVFGASSRKLEWSSIVVGEGSYIGARSMLIGAKLPGETVVAAGSVVTKDYSTAGYGILLAGNPAVEKTRAKAKVANVN